jgi:tetratricopeptide (TPR) repeat protein
MNGGSRLAGFPLLHWRESALRRPPIVHLLASLVLAVLLLGACSSTGGEREQAVEAFRQAVITARDGDEDRAIELAKEAIEKEPGFVEPRLLIAQIAEHREQWDEARTQYEDVLRYDATFTAVGVRIALTYVAERRFDEAQDWLMRALEADPGSFQAAFNLGTLSVQRGDLEAAIGWYQLATALEPRDIDAPTRTAELLMERGDAVGALAAAEEALERERTHHGEGATPAGRRAAEIAEATRAKLQDGP